MNLDALLTRLAAMEVRISHFEEPETLLRAELACAEEKARQDAEEIARLRTQVEKLNRILYGTRSEKLLRQAEQADVLDEQRELENARAGSRKEGPAAERTPRSRRPLPENLPREIHRLESAAPCCPECGSDMDYLGEVSAEQLELVTSALKVIRTVRVKKACVKCDCIVEAPAPSRPIERGIAGPGLLARVLTAKYCEHLPLYRQCEIFARQGVVLSRTLLSNWVEACCYLLSPLNEALYRYVMDTRKLHTDDTPVPVQAPGTRKTKTGRIWRMCATTATRVRQTRRRCGSPTRPTVRANTRKRI